MATVAESVLRSVNTSTSGTLVILAVEGSGTLLESADDSGLIAPEFQANCNLPGRRVVRSTAVLQ
jgi:hypothetical protein